MPAPRAIMLYGPTASGKSALAMRLARAHGNAVLINADSMQVYAGMPILTACPPAADMAEIPHRLFGYLDPEIPCSVGLWMEAARIAIYETWQAGKLPILVGGTGMYVRALMEGISPMPEISEAIRQNVRNMPVEQAYARLSEHDAAMADKLKPGDTQRIARALEVLLETGRSLLYWQAIPMEKPIPEADFQLYCLNLPRELLYEHCEARLDGMIEQGALEEVKSLLVRGLAPSLPAMRAVGVPELAAHVKGELTLNEALSKAKQATRNYAKRQLTWQRNQFENAPILEFPYDSLPPLI